jgi:hypothetical protein
VPPLSRLILMRRESRVALADELDLVIGDNFEAVAVALADGAMLGRPQADAPLRASDEEGPGIIDLPPPVEAMSDRVPASGATISIFRAMDSGSATASPCAPVRGRQNRRRRVQSVN